LTHTAAAPITPLTMSWVVRPGCGSLNSVRHHQGTSNGGTVSAPIRSM
jgi:hypothetical protein